jgi:hypothetical protein
MKKLLVAIIIGSVILVAGTVLAQGWSGYNWKARVFVGTGSQWCLERNLPSNCLGIYSSDKLTMKWSQAWQMAEFGPNGIRGDGDELPWTSDAWENNEWNGVFPGGSGSVWHYNIQWVGLCGADYTPLPDGGYCLWGQFEVLMDHGIDPNIGPGHIWFAHAIPTGYGN